MKSKKDEAMLLGMLAGTIIVMLMVIAGMLMYIVFPLRPQTKASVQIPTAISTQTRTNVILPDIWTPTMTLLPSATPTMLPSSTPIPTGTPFRVKIPKQPVYSNPQGSQSGSCPGAYNSYLHESYLQYLTSSYQSSIDYGMFYVNEAARMGNALESREWLRWIKHIKAERDAAIAAENASYESLCR
jgi:hypothetical protein